MTEAQLRNEILSMSRSGYSHTNQARILGITALEVQRIVADLKASGIYRLRQRGVSKVEATEIVRLIESGYTQVVAAQRLGVSQQRVAAILKKLRENNVPILKARLKYTKKRQEVEALARYVPDEKYVVSDRDVAASIVKLRTEKGMAAAGIANALRQPYERIVHLLKKMAQAGIQLPPADPVHAQHNYRMAVLNMCRRGLPASYMAEILGRTPEAIAAAKLRLVQGGHLRREPGGYPLSLYPVDE